MNNTLIVNELERLETSIKQSLITATTEFEGADVIICSTPTDSQKKWAGDQNIVIGLQNTSPQKRLVVTKYSQELSGLFFELQKIFDGRHDFISKYDFYGLLAQSALDYLNSCKGNENLNELLLAVLSQAKKFMNE